MTVYLESAVPTEDESDIYFRGLPANPRSNHSSQRSAIIAFNASKINGERDNIAEINKDSPAVVAFADGVSAENREAVLLGVEFAEVVATSRADINSDPIQWLTEYALAMRNAGWLTLGGHEYGDYTASSQSLTMDSVVLELIGAVAGVNAATVISLLNIVIDKLQKDVSLMQLFERNAKKGNTSTFRIMPCIESSQGIPITYLLSVHCTYSSSSGGALFWKWSVSKLQIKRLAKGVQFSKATYERNKDRVVDYLNGNADDFFAGLK